MKLITLTEKEFKKFADKHNQITFHQTKEWADLTEDQKKLFEGLFNYWKAHNENGTDLWDKDAAGGYMDAEFKTGGADSIKIDGPWATTNVRDNLVGSAENLEIIPLTNINGKKFWLRFLRRSLKKLGLKSLG